jgi:hypothetical protein
MEALIDQQPRWKQRGCCFGDAGQPGITAGRLDKRRSRHDPAVFLRRFDTGCRDPVPDAAEGG